MFSRGCEGKINHHHQSSFSRKFLRSLFPVSFEICDYIFSLTAPTQPSPHRKALMYSAAPKHDCEQFPFTRTPRVLLKYDMSHHFAFIISHLQWSREKLGLIVPKVRSLGLLITCENPVELPRWASGHRPNELIPRLCCCVAMGIKDLAASDMCQPLPS